ncbi:DUF2946 domain-containing protein [Pseudomonas sp. BRM28]|uniref:DUF2946 domain-containing protein n=1 Tax=Pseudomonas sp. BRM28 TaxID=2045201 RepID=UPI000CEF1462|nr:DUF2946 domain-containing protein [Pseudomonas sp. BRM28]PPS63524.1 hypothetical protein CR917_22125 [Pseudomonas sp. BRM28]
MRLPRGRLARPADLQRARGSWLSLFAMLMIFIGPLVSQSMPMDHRASMPGMDMAMDCHSGSHASSPAALHVIWEKCGYCSLFFHCPALPQTLSLLDTEAVSPHTTLRAQPRQGHARQAIFPGARSRAPPAHIVV